MNRLIAIAAVALSLGGCETVPDVEEMLKAQIVTDNFCIISRKMSWDVADTWQTIDEARRVNERIDANCPPGSPARVNPAVKAVS